MDLVNRSKAWSKSKPARRSRLQQEARIGLLFLSPRLLGFLFLKAAPILASLVFSLTNFQMLSPGDTKFIGFSNYAHFVRDGSAVASLYLGVSPLLRLISFGVQLSQSFVFTPEILMVGALLVMVVPVIVLFLSQRFFMQDMVITQIEK